MDMKVREELKRGLESANQLRILYSESQGKQEQKNETLMACMKHHSSVILKTFETVFSILNDGRLMENNATTTLKYRRITQPPQPVKMMSTTAVPEDGRYWRKYGQKPIANTEYPREYYRCGHKESQGCQATKQVQLISAKPTKYEIIYYGDHTCQYLPNNASQFDDLLVETIQNYHPKCFQSSNSHTKAKQGLDLIKPDQEKLSLPHDQYAPSSSDLPTLGTVTEDVALPEWCYSIESPRFIDVDQKYLVTDCADLDGGFEDLRPWEL